MGELSERVKLSMLVNGNGLIENFQNNSNFFAEKYTKSEKNIEAVDVKDLQLGRFYHFHCIDNSNWVRYSPVFLIEQKKFANIIMVIGINLNFIPLKIRETIFDNFISEKNFEQDIPVEISVNFIRNELIKYGFEYSLIEYNVKNIVLAHKISFDMVPRFIYSAHPENTYDPEKLYEIWKAKVANKFDRASEMNQLLMSDLLSAQDEINQKFTHLNDHIFRVQNRIKGSSRKR